MIMSVGDKTMKEITFIQITYGRMVDFRDKDDNIIHSVSMTQLSNKDLMVFIYNDEENK